MAYKLDDNSYKLLRDTFTYLNLVEVKGGANVGNLFQALVRIEAIINQLDKTGEEKEKTPKKKEEET
jgi:hypothetical protein